MCAAKLLLVQIEAENHRLKKLSAVHFHSLGRSQSLEKGKLRQHSREAFSQGPQRLPCRNRTGAAHVPQPRLSFRLKTNAGPLPVHLPTGWKALCLLLALLLSSHTQLLQMLWANWSQDREMASGLKWHVPPASWQGAKATLFHRRERHGGP